MQRSLNVIIIPLKLLAIVRPPLLDHMNKVVSQDKRHTLSVYPKFSLEVAKEVSKVNVEQLKKIKKIIYYNVTLQTSASP